MEAIEADIVQELMNRRAYAAGLQRAMRRLYDSMDEEGGRQAMIFERRLMRIDHWLSLLDGSEAFVVRLHLIEGRPWAVVEREYGRMCGEETPCEEDSLTHYELRAIRKIRRLVMEEYEAECPYNA